MDSLVQQILVTDNLLQDDYHRDDSKEIQITLWQKSLKKQNFPKTLNAFMHVLSEKEMLLLFVNAYNRLEGFVINPLTQQVESKVWFTCDENVFLDLTLLHSQSFLIQRRLFFIQNINKNEQHHVLIADLATQKILPIFNAFTKPYALRRKYSATLFSDYQILMFGGLDEQNNPLNYLEQFNISTYEWELMETKGVPPSPRHSHQALTTSQSLIVFGGSVSLSAFDKQLMDCFALDMRTKTWTQVKMQGQIPRTLSYSYLVRFTTSKYIYLYEENDIWSISQLNVTNNDVKWEPVKHPREPKVTPEYRYHATACLNKHENAIYVYGGSKFNAVESGQNILEKLRIVLEGERAEDYEVYNGQKLQQSQYDVGKFIEDSSEEEITFEELLEREKKLQEEENRKKEQAKKKKQQKKKKKQLQK